MYTRSDLQKAKDQALHSNRYADGEMVLNNYRIGKLPVPSAFANIAGVYRPEQYKRDKADIDALVASIASQVSVDAAAQAAAGEAAATGLPDSNAVMDNETAVQLTLAYDLHRDEDEEANTGAIIAVIIGAILMFGLLGYCLWKACRSSRRMEMQNARGGQQKVMVNSFRSDATPN